MSSVASAQSPVRFAVLRQRPVALVTVATFALYALIAWARHRQFNTAGYDLGIFDQAVRRYAHFDAPMVPLKGLGYNIFGDHFHPIIAVAAPLYWLWNTPLVLLFVQAALIASSVPVVYRFTLRRTSANAALGVAVAYALGWPLQTMVNFQFHEVAFGVPLVALAVDALDRADDRALLLWSGLLLLVREDMGIIVAGLAFLRFFRRPRWPALALVVAGVAAYEVTTAVILPHFSPNGQFAYWQYTETLGKDLPSAVWTILTRPWHAVALFFTPWVKTKTLALLFVPLLLLPLRSRYVILALPLLAQRFFEPHERYRLWEPGFHYNALPWVILVLAAVDGAGRLGWWDRDRLRRAIVGWMVASSLVVIQFFHEEAIINKLVYGGMFSLTSQMRDQFAAVAAVPHNACVEADDRLAGHLTSHDFVTLPTLMQGHADFIAVDLSQKDVGNAVALPQPVYDNALARGYRVVFSRGSIRVLESPSYRGPSPACSPLGSGPVR